MAGIAAMRPETEATHALDSVAWETVQDAVRSFRRAWLRGERPLIESFADGDDARRKAILAELIHEEMDLRVEGGESPCLAPYLERFPEVAGEARLVHELIVAESELRRWREAPEWTPRLNRGDDPPRSASRSAAGAPSSAGRYELREVIGRGAFGVVHRAYDPTLRRAVALKRARPGSVETPEVIERFLREARAVAALRHPSIVPIHDAGQADGEVYLVSDLIDGRNLADELAVRRPGSRLSAGWIAALAEALEHAHSLGLIHRDVKPSNVLIDAEDRVYLTDFGLARSDGDDATPTTDGRLIGTPAYMAPEQAQGGPRSVDARADVYSLGVILYELLTGSRPFAGAGAMLLARIREEDPRPPRRLDGTIPRDLETICLKCLRKAPRDRYATAGALAEELRRYLAGRPIVARPVPARERAARWARRRPATAALVALTAASALGLIGARLHELDRERPHARSMLSAAGAHADGLRREARATRRHLDAVEVDRADDAYDGSQAELARQILARDRPGPVEEDLRGFEWDSLRRPCDRDRVLRGHEARINDLAFSPDGRVLASVGGQEVRLWDVESGSPLAVLEGHRGLVFSVAFDPTGRWLASGAEDQTVRLWDVAAHREAGVLRGHVASIRTLLFSPDGRRLASGGRDGHILLWDVATRLRVARLTGHTMRLNQEDFFPDGQAMVSTSFDRTIRIWRGDPAGR